MLITRGAPAAEAQAVQRRAKAGELVRIAENIYLAEKDPEAQAAVVRRNCQRIVRTAASGGVVSHTSAHAGGITPEGVVVVSQPTNYNRTINLPGLRVVPVKGRSALPGDTLSGATARCWLTQP